MKNTLPRYHTVRVALLDSIKNQNVQKVSSIAALHTSLRDWLEVLKLAMRRYGIQPEPRGSWLAIWARVQPMYETQAGLAAVIERHLQATQVRTSQDLDGIITFVIGLEAELAGILQDTSGQTSGAAGKRQQASAQSAGLQSPDGSKKDPPKGTDST
eukprot:2227325-Amphidinium_carterae.2